MIIKFRIIQYNKMKLREKKVVNYLSDNFNFLESDHEEFNNTSESENEDVETKIVDTSEEEVEVEIAKNTRKRKMKQTT